MIGPLIDGAIKRRKVVLGVTFIACLFGFFAYLTMPREAQPDIKLPYIFIVVPFPGVSPEDAERLLVKPLEVQLQTIKGVKHMNSVARQNQAIVTLEFDPSFSTDKALADEWDRRRPHASDPGLVKIWFEVVARDDPRMRGAS